MTNRPPSRTYSPASPSSSVSTRRGRSSSTETNTRFAPGRSGLDPPAPATERSLQTPLFLLNLKCYPPALGEAADRLARNLAQVGREYGVCVAISPALPDLGRIAALDLLPVISPHCDPHLPGASTGYTIAEALRAAGVSGSLVNHSEHRLAPSVLRTTVDRLRSVGLVSVLCTRDLRESVRRAALAPTYLAVEPADLIGGSRSVSTARPELIRETVTSVYRVAPSVRVLCGAGIQTGRDVSAALALGSQGILVASAVATARDPRAKMIDLATGF
jgi:triosephosphate isomerase